MLFDFEYICFIEQCLKNHRDCWYASHVVVIMYITSHVASIILQRNLQPSEAVVGHPAANDINIAHFYCLPFHNFWICYCLDVFQCLSD